MHKFKCVPASNYVDAQYNYSLNRNTAPGLKYDNKDTSNSDTANNKTNNFNYMFNKHTHTEHYANFYQKHFFVCVYTTNLPRSLRG